MMRGFLIASLFAVATACRGQAPPTEGEEATQAPGLEDSVPSVPDDPIDLEQADDASDVDMAEPVGDVSDVGAVDPINAAPPAAQQGEGKAEAEGASPSGSQEVIEEYDVGGSAPEPEDVVEPLPKKKPIPPSGVPIEGPSGDPIEGPSGVPIQGPRGVPIEGTDAVPIEEGEDQEADRWGD